MCSVMAAIGGVLTGLQGYSSYRANAAAIEAQADSQESMYRAQAQAAERNARMESRRQEQIADQYGAEQRRLRERQRLAAGKLRADTGAAGLDMAGSPLDIAASSQEAYEQDKLTLLGNQRNDNYNSRAVQVNYENEAGTARAAAANVRADADRALNANLWGSILGTASSLAPFASGLGGSSGGTDSAVGFSFGTDNPYAYAGASGNTWAAPLRLQTVRNVRGIRQTW